MKKGEGENKHSRRITMSVTAGISPNESNWGGKGGCLHLLWSRTVVGSRNYVSDTDPSQRFFIYF
jgi:hypothetical protein